MPKNDVSSQRAYQLRVREETGLSSTRLSLLRKNGISIEEYRAAQTAGCELCGGQNPDGTDLALDHNHETDEFRGWLCRPCNAAIGLLGDDPERVIAAAAYLMERNSG